MCLAKGEKIATMHFSMKFPDTGHYVLTGLRLVETSCVQEEAAIEIASGRILRTGNFSADPAIPQIDCKGLIAAPGFIDIHIHGGNGRDTMEATPEAFEAICRAHAAGGTTGLLLTTVTAKLEDVEKTLDAVRAWQKNPAHASTGARVLGAHVEGPFLSPAKAGAQDTAHMRPPRPEDVERILAYQDVVKKITLAPELPGALEAIRRFSDADIRTSAGHSDAWETEALAAFDAGLTQATHVFNCMSGARKQGAFRIPGLLECALADPSILCELVADGRHVAPTLMRLLFRCKGHENVCLITDASAGCGLPEDAEFLLGGLPCVVRDGCAMIRGQEVLAGSTLTMMRSVAVAVETGVPLPDAVRMAGRVPAEAIGCGEKYGRIAPGRAADIVLFDDNFDVHATLVDGRPVYQKSCHHS